MDKLMWDLSNVSATPALISLVTTGDYYARFIISTVFYYKNAFLTIISNSMHDLLGIGKWTGFVDRVYYTFESYARLYTILYV